ncbi:MAG: hypothetical protein LBS63_02985 [Prevotellaceae bacterium]|jgi:hypothetical protein|nr:hypothetical protein [Prevotellaceae bacterium]
MEKLFTLTLCVALSAGVLCSCDQLRNDEPLAEVDGEVLYLSSARHIFPKQVTPEDSLAMLRSYVASWVKKDLMLRVAEENLTSKQKDVSDLLEDYRCSLLIYRYEQEYIERIDTTVHDSMYESFYNAHKQYFALNKPIVRALLIKLKRSSPHADSIKKLCISNRPNDNAALEHLGLQAALRFDYFGDRWLTTDELLSELPPGKSYEPMLQRRFIEVEDNAYTYFVTIRDFRARNTLAPISYKRDEIKAMIFNQRKQAMIKDLEQRVLQNAEQKERVKIFIQDGL